MSRGRVAGFAFGELPADLDLERWGIFDQMYRRYTPRPGSGVGSADD